MEEVAKGYCVDSKLYRLKYVLMNAETTGSEVAERCIRELRECVGKTRNIGFFKSLSPEVRARVFSEIEFNDWCSKVNKESTRLISALKAEAERADRTAKQQQQAYTRMARELFVVGNIQDSLKTLSRARICTRNTVQNALLLHETIKYSLITGAPGVDYPSLFAQLRKLLPKQGEDTRDTEDEQEQDTHFYETVLSNNVLVLEGIHLIILGNFNDAALKLLSFCSEPDHWKDSGLCGTVATTHDIALYVTLCSLASFDRKEIKSRLANSPPFRVWEEACPEMSGMLKALVGLRYEELLSVVSKIPISQDIFMGNHADTLVKHIQRQVILQSLQPYSAVSFTKLSQSTGVPPETLTGEVESLVENGTLCARIDTAKGIVLMENESVKQKAAEQVTSAGKTLCSVAESILLRISLETNILLPQNETDNKELSMTHKNRASDSDDEGPNSSSDESTNTDTDSM